MNHKKKCQPASTPLRLVVSAHTIPREPSCDCRLIPIESSLTSTQQFVGISWNGFLVQSKSIARSDQGEQNAGKYQLSDNTS